MADLRKFQTDELLNKVLNSGEDALKVDVDNVTLTTEGGDVAIDVALDKANDSVTVYANTAADGSGTSTVPLVDSDGHLQIDAVSTALPSGAATAANQSTIIGHVDGVETLLTGIDSDTNDIKTDAAAIEVLLTAANVDHAANEVLLTNIDADTNAIKIDMAAIEVLLTAANVDHAANETLLTGIDADTDAIKTDMAAIEVLLTAANVDHAANEALLTTIDSDTNDIKTATESSNTHLGNMFYDTALAVTPHDTNDLSGEPYFAVWVGTGGNLKVDMSSGTGTVTLNNCASGQLIPIMVERIYATGTTASNIIVFK